ncbi:MAG: methionine--tRNA ligase [Gammaproteobacteria bacterium]|nr:methionine--tRNA ligase [Gammaproteobacteria bacterium]
MSSRNILVTSALPYANGPIHLGHLVEYIQTDIWVRFQKQCGNICHYVCADDAHGTAIMLKAQQEQIDPEQLIEQIAKDHQTDFSDFSVAFDHYHSTHSPENRELSEQIYRVLREKDLISTRTISQLFDPEKNMFLPDRFIKGECPQCGAADQHGDNCEVCGATYAPSDLKNPISAVSGATPVEKSSLHYFFKLPEFTSMLKEWAHAGHLQPEMANKIDEWLTNGLEEWDISRDAPYFGFEIPDAPGKYFYVWLDAPIGYMASFRALCEKQDLNFDDYWKPGQDTELYHFIGKDIINFHALFWPSMLEGAGYKTPNGVFAHGFLTVDGQKMSKSRGTFITARKFLDHLQPEHLRYYFAARLSNGVDDIDLSFDDFTQRINSDLVGKVVNIASRCSGFIKKRGDNTLSEQCCEPDLFQTFVNAQFEIAGAYESREYSKAMRKIMELADLANQYIDEKKPWVIAKDQDRNQELIEICSMGINLFRLLMAYLRPVLPKTAVATEAFLNIDPQSWPTDAEPLLNHAINNFNPLMTRVNKDDIDAMLGIEKESTDTDQKPADEINVPAAPRSSKNIDDQDDAETIAEQIDFKDFTKVDLRVVKITKAEDVKGTKKLLKLTLDLGGNETRQVFAGIKSAYNPEDLEGSLTVMVANLKPRKMRFGVSEGMVLAAGPGGSDIFLLEPDEGAEPGMRIK